MKYYLGLHTHSIYAGENFPKENAQCLFFCNRGKYELAKGQVLTGTCAYKEVSEEEVKRIKLEIL